MKYILAFMIALSITAQPYADQDEQLFRCLVPGIGFSKKVGGLYEKVQAPRQLIESQKDLDLYYKKKLADMELSHKQALMDKDQKAIEQQGNSKALAMKWGNRLFFGGLVLFVIGIIAACVLKNYGFEIFGVAAAGIGVTGIAIGAVLIETVEHYEATIYTVLGLVTVVTLVVVFHGKGFDVVKFWKEKQKGKIDERP